MDQYFENRSISSAIVYAVASLLGTYILVFITHELLEKRLVK